MLIYRITHKNFSKQLAASGLKGRWNSAGNKVLYCAESIALAFLENMVRRQGVGFNDDFKIMIIEVPDKLATTVINHGDLKDGWQDFKNYSHCLHLGDQWYQQQESAILKAPSAILPVSFNYVINTEHEDYKHIKLLDVTDLMPDKRIEEILKKYSS